MLENVDRPTRPARQDCRPDDVAIGVALEIARRVKRIGAQRADVVQRVVAVPRPLAR